MRVRTFIFLLILACCACALIVFWKLNSTFDSNMAAQESVNQKKLALRDLSNLEVTFGQWLLLSDLVLGNDQTYLQQGALETSEKLVQQTEALERELAFSTDSTSQLKEFEGFLDRQKSRLNEASELTAVDRSANLNKLLNQMDQESSLPIEALAAIREKLEASHELAIEHLQTSQAYGKRKRAFLIVFFLSSISLLWFLCTQFLTRPLTQLTKESRLAMQDEQQISRLSSGSVEITELRNSFADLVENLKDKVKEVHQEQLQRDRMHEEMIQMSRKAGMAEVASGVLHNVGNVLNSINVSASVTRKQLEDSVIEKLVYARDVVMKNKHDLENFLANDRKGRHFPGALDGLTNTLVAENELLRRESDLLIENIEHIRSVINTQQSSARFGGLMVTFPLADAIQQSIQILSDTLVNNDVRVSVNCCDSYNLTTDKDKLKQILINLISNASDSIVDHDCKRQISIDVAELEDSFQISVQDTGAGIRQENMENLFLHGFTTKQSGHGFGLHNCALTAQNLGGELCANSEGAGLGATFILTLPKEQIELCKI